jgi:hypothetical protein
MPDEDVTGPEPVPDPGEPEPPVPLPPPDPGEPEPDRTGWGRVEVELCGSVAIVSGVIDRLEEGDRIVERLATLGSLTSVENRLRLRPA